MINSSFPLDYRNRRIQITLKVPVLMLLAVALFSSLGHASAQTRPQTKPSPAAPVAVELHIAAAADLQPVLPALAAEFEKTTGIHIIASFGSSATLTQQIINGDPQDIFLSADFTHPEQLVAAGLTTEKAPVPYARGVLVLWARKDSPAQPLSLDSMSSDKVTKIAVANPLHAPYGLAAQKALESLHLAGATKDKLVVAENIGQTAQFAESGNAQLGLISRTIATSAHYREIGSFILLPPGSYPEIRQCGVILKSSKNQSAAHDFLHWLTSPGIQQGLHTFGLDPVE